MFRSIIVGIFLVGVCHSQGGCVTCRSRRRLSDFSTINSSEKTLTFEQYDEIKNMVRSASQKVETVTQFTDLNKILAKDDVGLKAVSGAVDSISLTFLGFIRDLVDTLDAIPIVGTVSGAFITVFQAVDDVFYDVLDVILVFLRDDVIGGLVGADASVSSDAPQVGIVKSDAFLDFFPPMESFVAGVEEAVGFLDRVVSDPEAAQQAVLNATGLSIERVTPVLGPLAVLESIVSDTLDDISCLLDDTNTTCGGDKNSTNRCNRDRLLCSVQSIIFGGKFNSTETEGVETPGTNVTNLSELTNGTGILGSGTPASNSTDTQIDSNATETNVTHAEIHTNATGSLENLTMQDDSP